jgi:hypothetical protein
MFIIKFSLVVLIILVRSTFNYSSCWGGGARNPYLKGNPVVANREDEIAHSS